jgi:bacterial/archaeal transporter family protein
MENYRWLLFAIAGATFAAIVSVMTKRALDKVDIAIAMSVQSVAMLMTFAVLTTVLARWNKINEAPRMAVGIIAVSGVVAGLAWFCGYRALQLSKVSSATPIDRLSLAIAVILAMIFLGEKPSIGNWVGITMMVVGSIIIARSANG